jgi:WD40 repeat protein
VQSGELLQAISAHEGRIWSVAINPASTLVVSGGEDKTVGIWQVRSGESVLRFNDHQNRVRSVCFKPYTQNNTHDYVVSGSHDGTVKLGFLRTDIPRETLRSDRPYRGHMGEKDPWQTQGGMVTEPLLHALNIPIWHLNEAATIHRRLKDAQTLVHASLHPVAVLLSREIMWEE